MVSLALTTAHNWRAVRARLLLAGHSDPLRSLPDLHSLLDVTEAMLVETMEKDDLAKFYQRMYMPEVGSLEAGVVPAGFAPEEQLASFDAFDRATAGLH